MVPSDVPSWAGAKSSELQAERLACLSVAASVFVRSTPMCRELYYRGLSYLGNLVA